MANHKSAAKRARQSERKTKVNSISMSSVRTAEKKLRVAIGKNAKKNTEEVQTLFKVFCSRISKAAKKGIVHANMSSRKISRLATQINSARVNSES